MGRIRLSAALLLAALLSAGCAAKRTNPQAGVLLANLWMQSSAEYAALCLQTYRLALPEVLGRIEAARGGAKPPAVVMDLDETVIDNAEYQTFLYRNRLNYSAATWQAWERHQAGLERPAATPGVIEFIHAVEQAGGTVVYISNRRESTRDLTVETLRKLGVLEEDDRRRLLLRTDGAGKEERRQAVRERYEVVALVGDNLADFSEEFEASGANAEERVAAVRRAEAEWGARWFVLPNPAYGDWVAALGEPLGEKLRGPSRLPGLHYPPVW